MNILFHNGHERSFGTFPLRGDVLHHAMASAIGAGYRAFDTAQMYGNEAEVGAALAGCGIARKDLFVTTKVGVENLTPARFMPSVERSLADLQTDQVDALLLHWPTPGGDIREALDLLQDAKAQGHARHIGLSNST